MKIFIVDDDTMLTEALSDYLSRKSDAEITVFDTGEECLQHMDEKPDGVILDYYLNTVQKEAANGMEILKAIQKKNPDTHVIMLSGQEHYGVALKIVKQGAEQYVIKDEKSFAKIASMIEDWK
jgi:DNA-binding NarL/FixJ family response regulator